MRTYPGHTNFVESIAFHPDGQMLASGSADGTVRVWDVVSGECERVLEAEGKSKVGAVAICPNGRFLLWGDYGGNLVCYDLSKGKIRSSRTGQGRIVGVDFGGVKWGAWASYSGVSASSFESLQRDEPRRLAVSSPKPFCLSVSPSTGLIGVGHQSAEVKLYDVRGSDDRVVPHGQSLGCWSLAFSPDGHTLALALANGVQLWDVASQQLLTTLGGHSDVVSGIAYSASGDRLVTCSFDGTVRLYRVSAGRSPTLIESYDWKLGRLFCVAISPDGTLAAVGGESGDYLLAWDVE